jgi:hypothetical protein
MASSSSNEAVTKMVNKTTPALTDYLKKSTITEVDRIAYHITSWLGGALVFHPYSRNTHFLQE